MSLDEAFLQAHREFEDPVGGYREAFVDLPFDTGGTIGIVSTPVRPGGSTGWVICHSFALEQVHLARHDATLARGLAAAGAPVLRFHGPGYGDSQAMEDPGLDGHLSAAGEAVAWMAARPGVERVGVVGARFGGLVAALTADRLDLPAMVLIEPVVKGARFMRDFLWTRAFAHLVGTEVRSLDPAGEGRRPDGDGNGSGEPSVAVGLKKLLHEAGWADVKGFRLTREAFEQIGAVDLTGGIERFHGRALLVAVTRNENVPAATAKLAERLEGLGAQCTVRAIPHRMSGQFGQFHFQTVDGGRAKVDVQADLEAELGRVVARWATASDPAGGAP